jgi:hypothetical protein
MARLHSKNWMSPSNGRLDPTRPKKNKKQPSANNGQFIEFIARTVNIKIG